MFNGGFIGSLDSGCENTSNLYRPMVPIVYPLPSVEPIRFQGIYGHPPMPITGIYGQHHPQSLIQNNIPFYNVNNSPFLCANGLGTFVFDGPLILADHHCNAISHLLLQPPQFRGPISYCCSSLMAPLPLVQRLGAFQSFADAAPSADESISSSSNASFMNPPNANSPDLDDDGLIKSVSRAWEIAFREYVYGNPMNDDDGSEVQQQLENALNKMNETEKWTKFATELIELLKCVVEFAKALDGFKHLNLDDQINTLKGSCFQMSIIAMAKLHLPIMDTLLKHYANSSNKLDAIFGSQILNAIETIRQFHLTIPEVALLSAYVLLAQSPMANIPLLAQFKQCLLIQMNHHNCINSAMDMDFWLGAILPTLDCCLQQLLNQQSRIEHFDPTFKKGNAQTPQLALFSELFSQQ